MESEKERLEAALKAMSARTVGLHPVLLQAEPEPLEIDLQRTVVIVIDMQNCFISKGGMFDLWGWDILPSQKIVEPIKKITDAARIKGLKVIKVVHIYSPDLCNTGGPNLPNWYKDPTLPSYREHPEWRDKFNIRGTWGAEIVDELRVQEGDLLVEKPSFGVFFQTNLDILLKTYDIKYLIFAGVTTNCCVETSIREAFHLGYFCILVSDATMNDGPAFVKDASIYNIKSLFGWVTTMENVLRAIG